MKNTIYLENGIKHELTPDEIKVLRIALEDFNECSLPLVSVARENEYLSALESLKSLFLEQLD